MLILLKKSLTDSGLDSEFTFRNTHKWYTYARHKYESEYDCSFFLSSISISWNIELEIFDFHSFFSFFRDEAIHEIKCLWKVRIERIGEGKYRGWYSIESTFRHTIFLLDRSTEWESCSYLFPIEITPIDWWFWSNGKKFSSTEVARISPKIITESTIIIFWVFHAYPLFFYVFGYTLCDLTRSLRKISCRFESVAEVSRLDIYRHDRYTHHSKNRRREYHLDECESWCFVYMFHKNILRLFWQYTIYFFQSVITVFKSYSRYPVRDFAMTRASSMNHWFFPVIVFGTTGPRGLPTMSGDTII